MAPVTLTPVHDLAEGKANVDLTIRPKVRMEKERCRLVKKVKKKKFGKERENWVDGTGALPVKHSERQK